MVKPCRTILESLDKHNVRAKCSKFTYGRRVNYASLRLSEDGLLSTVKIIESILNIGRPNNISQLRRFLGSE